MDEKLETTKSSGQTQLSRRTVAKGIAWGVPAITVLGATPAFAATGDPTITSTQLQGTRGTEGNKANVSFRWTFTSSVPVTSVSTSIENYDPVGTVVLADLGNGRYSAEFAVRRRTGNSNLVPSFTLTVTYANGNKTFTVTEKLVEEGNTEPFPVS